MSRHTPGPWIYEPSDMTIRTKDFDSVAGMGDYRGVIIAELDSPEWRKCRPESIQEKEANARLIAAAPEMYDTLKNIRSYITASCPDAYGVKTVIGKLDTLLAKIDATNSPEKGKGGL